MKRLGVLTLPLVTGVLAAQTPAAPAPVARDSSRQPVLSTAIPAAGTLVAVTASSNRGKGDQDPGEWLPLLERCRYIGEWVAVKHRWALSVDPVEKDALNLQASNCENVTIPVIER